MRVFSQINKSSKKKQTKTKTNNKTKQKQQQQQTNKRGAPLLGLAKSIYYERSGLTNAS